MKEQIMFGLFTVLMGRKKHDPRNVFNGAGLILAGIAIYGAIMIVMQGYILKYPIFFLTNPAFFLLALLFLPRLNMGGGIHLLITVFSVPAAASLTFTICNYFINNVGFDIPTSSLTENYRFLLNAAYGSLAEQFNYYGILLEIVNTRHLSFVVFAYIVAITCFLATFINVMYFPIEVSSWLDYYSDSDFDEEYQKERWFFTRCLGFFGTGLFYWLAFPYFEFVQGLPFGLSYIATWLLLLTPLLGLGLCEVNRCRRFEHRVGNRAINLYMLLLVVMCGTYYMTHAKEFNAYLNQCLQGDYQNVSSIVYPLTLFLLPYMLINRKKQPSRKQVTS